MGELNVSLPKDIKKKQAFVRALLNDVKALEHMLDNDMFESGITRIGAEQEMCINDSATYKPAPIAMELLELMKEHKWAETELAKFNLEINLDPRKLEGDCFSQMHKRNF